MQMVTRQPTRKRSQSERATKATLESTDCSHTTNEQAEKRGRERS